METKSKKKIRVVIVLAVAIATIAIASAISVRIYPKSTNPSSTSGSIVTSTLSMGSLYYQRMKRTYWIHVPSSYDGLHQVPLVLGLHGAGGDGFDFILGTGWVNLSEKNGFIAVCPTGSLRYAYGFKWNIYNWVDFPDDVGFLMALINKIKSAYLIDPSRVYMTGYSNGASMTNTFAFKYANVLAAAVPVSGRWMTEMNIDPYNISQPNAPLPVYIWRGEKETSRDVQDQLQKQYWMDWNKVNKTPTYVTEGIYKTEIYTGGEAEVRFTEIYNRGHDTYDPNTTAKIWHDFFTQISSE